MAGFLYKIRTRCSRCQMFLSHSVTDGEASNDVSQGNGVPYKYVKLRSIAIAVLTSWRTIFIPLSAGSVVTGLGYSGGLVFCSSVKILPVSGESMFLL